MSTLDDAHKYIYSGKFLHAIACLSSLDASEDKLECQVLEAFVLERLGHHARARTAAESLLANRLLKAEHKSLLEQVLATIDIESGRFTFARTHLQRSVSFATESGVLERLCWAQLRLWSYLCDAESVDAAAPLLRELRANSIRTADPVVSSALHAYVGESEGKRGLIESARRHTRTALKLLETTENVWLQATCENTNLAVSLMRSDYRSALAHGLRAVALAEASGVASAKRACLGNLGNTFLLRGELDQAARHLEEARSCLGANSENACANTDSLARICLAKLDFAKCAEHLDRIEATIRGSVNRSLFAYRFSSLTRAQLLLRIGDINLAAGAIDETLKLASSVGDRRLTALAIAVRGEISVALGDTSGALHDAATLLQHFGQSDVEVYGRYLALCALIANATDQPLETLAYYDAAKRICSSVSALNIVAELTNAIEPTLAAVTSRIGDSAPEVGRSRGALAGVSAMLLFPDRPEIVANELERVLVDTEE